MINFLKNSISVIILFLILPKFGSSQSCIIPSINAQAGTGPSTTICSGQCAALTATMVAPPRSTTSYSVGAVTYSTMPYAGGNNVFATSSDDLWSDSINIGFPFCYFGNTYNKLLVGSNGEITFDLTKANQFESWVTSAVLPNLLEHPGNTICGAYRDYDPFPGGVVRTYTAGVAPCRQFIAYWSGVTLFSCATPLSSFQIILYEGSNNIAVNIVNSTACISWNSGRGLIGIQNQLATTVVAPPTRNTLTAWTAINESWLFVPTAAPSFSVNWAGPGGFSATGLTATPCPTATGTYSATLSYCNGSRTSTVQVNVSTPTINVSASSNTICPPGSVTLTATGATTYTWMPGSMTGSAVVVSPTVNTTYTVIGTAGTCTGSATIPITVGTAPIVSAFNLSGTICPGGTANAVASGALTYTWNPGGLIGNLVALSPTVSTIYTVTGSAGGCPGTATLLIPVGSSPTITALSSPTAICVGSTATLTASGATSYTWNPGALTGATVTVSPATTTIYTITGTSTLTCPGTQTVMLTVNTTPTLTAVSNPATICVGNSATLTSTGATSYTWMPGSLTGGTVTVFPVTTTIYTVTGSNGTCSSTRTVQTTVNTPPTVTASASSNTVCAGTSLTLTAGGATTYTWMPGSLTGAVVSVTPATNTTYTVTGSNGSCSNTATVSITVNPSPTLTAVANPTSICFGSGATVTLTSSGASTYTWMPGSLAGATVMVTPTITTTYTVSGTSSLSCIGTRTVVLTVNAQPTLTAVSNPTSICVGGSATLTSTGATSYTWMPGSLSGGTVTVSPGTTTTFTVTGSNGTCSNTNTVSVTVNTPPTVTASASSSTVCAGTSLTLTAGGATTYTWMPGSLTGATVAVTPTTNTTYTVTGANGTCTNTATVAITVNPTPTLTAVANPTSVCSGAGTTVTLTSTGATSYTWMPGSLSGGTVTVIPTITTTYTVTGASAAGCTKTMSVIVPVITTPTITASASSSTVCAGTSVTLTSSGATTYTWMPGPLSGGTVVATPTITTTYTVTGANGACTATNTVTVNTNPSPTVTAVASPTGICSGSSSTLTASGATSYTWMPGSLSGATVAVSPTVTTTYTLTGSNGTCSSSVTVVLTVTTTPTVTAVSNPTAICAGATATLSSSGATTYTWNPGSLTGITVTVSPASTTVYTVTGANGACTNTNTVSLTVNPLPTVTAVANPTAICSGNSSTLTGSGATTYTWMPGSLTGATVSVSPTITTTYTLTGNNGTCSNTTTVALIVNPTPTLTAVTNPTAICVGASATLTSSGATSYTWMPGSLTGGTVTVTPTVTTIYTVTGSSGLCSNTKTVSLTVNPNPTVTASASSPSICSGSTATLTGSGAATYTWMPGSLTGATVAVSPTVTTTYTVTGATAAGCTNTNTVALTVIPGPTLIAVANPTAICSGSSSTLTGSGATTYTWMPGSLPGGTVTVTPTITTTYTLTGNNGTCSSTIAVQVSVTPTPTVSAVSNPTAICAGSTATLTGSGATTYTWNPGAITGTSVSVSPTVTTIYTVTGANGACTNTNTISLTVNPTPTLVATSNPTTGIICAGRSATLTASGATTYTWMPGNMVAPVVVVSPTVNTTYTLSGTNASGCVGTTTILITVNPSPTITIAANPSTTLCSGQSATLTASGGVVGTYTWIPGPVFVNPLIITPLSTTTYTVGGANAFGCRSFTTMIINVIPTPTVTAASSSGTICSGQTVTLTSSGATTYTWNPGPIVGGTVTASPTVTTTYTVTGDNGGGCTNTNSVTVVVNPTPTVTAVSSPTAICSGSSATLTGSGATSYTWMPGSLTGATVVVSPTVTTNYTLTGSSGSCTNTAFVTLSVTTTPTITAVSNPTAICAGGSATLTSSGATSYTWMPGSLTGGTVTVTPTVTTVYTVTGANGTCTNTKTVSLLVNPIPTVTAVSNPTSMCAGSSATLTGSGATTYTWMPGSLTGTSVVVTPTINTTYTVTGSTAAGCSSTNTVSITVFSAPSIIAVTSKTAICLGDTATLSATGAISYTWNPGASTGSLVVVSPVTTTIYTVTGSNGICSSNATVSIVVNTFPTLTVTSSPATLCSGSSATLTGSGATTYTWMPGPLSGSTVVVTPTLSTTYTLTGANGSCVSTTTIALTVNSSPTVTAVSSPTAVCSGASATLTGSGATSYTWMPGSLTGTSVVVNPTATTQYTVIGSNGICSGTGTVNINVLPTPTVNAVANPTTICAGQTTTLIASGATSYTWMPPAITGATVVVSPTVTTTYSVTGINPLVNSCTNTKTLTVIVNSSPTITANTTATVLCSGTSATLTSSGATTYTWNPGSLTGGTVVVTPTATTTYTVVGANGICSTTKTVSILVNPTPTVTAVASATSICSGQTSILTASGATSYTWMPPAITGATVTVSPTVTTVYTVTGSNGLCSGTKTVLVIVNTPTITTIATPTAICIGGTSTITASGASSYTWMPPSTTGTSVVVSPTVTTTYTVTGVNLAGCSGTQTITLLVTPIPTVTAISNPTAVCAGSSATLTGSGTTTYTWMPGTLTGTSVVVTPTASTIYTVTGSNGACSSTGTVSLMVNPSPTVTAISNPTAICSGGSSTLSASGAVTYSWMPGVLTGTSVVVSPTATTVYTVVGTDALGCTSSNTVNLTVDTPTIIAIASPTSVCVVGSVTLTASGASTYTWSPIVATGSMIVISPTVTTTYTVAGTNTLGCSSTSTVTITVYTNPTVTAVASSTTLCSGYNATLTSSGALSYTWMPGSLTGGTVVVSPTITTTYSVIGVNGSCAADTATVTINVVPSPQNVTANNDGPITCLTTSVNLMGSTTSTNVTYLWNGPSSYTSATQNPTGITVGGVYTLSVIDISNGCITTATTSVITNTSGPTVSLTTSGTITCLSNTVSITASSTVAAVTYSWTGPSSFTSTATTFTTSTGGVYTVSVFDPASGCTSTNTIAAITDTYVAVTATIIPATCTGSVSSNNGTILASNFIATDKYDLVIGATYTGTATYATATIVSGIITTTLTNPTANQPYTIRFFGANGCFKDTTLILVPLDCAVNNALGLAKAITAVTTNTNGTYGVTYKVVVKNSGFAALNNVMLTENLSNTFPLPTTFTVSSAPVIITPVTSLTLDATFNGSTQPVITNTITSTLAVGEVDTIVFTVDVLPNGVFGTFNNSVLGAAVGGTASTAVADSSEVGLNTDPDADGDPTNNDIPTPLNLTPNLFFGVTKQGELSTILPDGSYDITYTVSIHNLGNDTLRNVVLKDSLAGTTIKSPASYTMKNGPTASGFLIANSAYNGNSDALLVLPASKVPPNSVQNVMFTINVFPDTVTVISNSATGSAMGSNSVTVRDTSNNGNNPDTNGNGIWNEDVDNVPTVLIIDNDSLFIPEAFTPDGDGVNDFFVIKGLKNNENTLTIFNRWGNKVYKMDNYDNTWSGMPNVSGTLGNQKLPQGTYYYILEFKGESKLENTNGFVVLQY